MAEELTEAQKAKELEEKYGFSYDVENWYDKCSSFTFPTKFISISKDAVHDFIRQYEKLVLGKKEMTTTEAEYNRIKQIEQQIDDIIQSDFCGSSVFVRMSARSPKDAAYQSAKMKEILKRKLFEIEEDLSGANLQNAEFAAFFAAQIESLEVESAQEAMELLFTSERVYTDLKIAIEANRDVQIVVRKWCAEQHVAHEFRGFVFDRKLTALSQYFDALYFSGLVKNKQRILASIQHFFETVKHQLPWDNCVMDFLLLEPYEDAATEGASTTSGAEAATSQVLAIEFNPFDRFTSAALFDWKKDIQTLKGEAPFEFRIVHRPLPVLKAGGIKEQGNVGASAMGSGASEASLSTRGNEDALFAQFNLMGMDEELQQQHAGLLNMVHEFMTDDFERINSNLGYVLQKKTKESLYEWLEDKKLE